MDPILHPAIGTELEEVCVRSAANPIQLESSLKGAKTIVTASAVEEADVLRGTLKAGSVAQVVVAIVATVGLLYLLRFVMVTVLVALLLAFILEPFVHVLSRIASPLIGLIDEIFASIAEFRGPVAQHDDMTTVVARVV